MKDKQFFILAFLFINAALYADLKTSKTPSFFDASNGLWSFLWTGSWEHEKSLVNRGDLWVYIPWQTFSLRLQVIDKRPVPPWEHIDAGITALSGGIYHQQTGSRLLYGIITEWGLAERLRSPWSSALPFAENHRPSGGDLQTTPSSSKKPGTYLYLKSPQLGMFKGYMSAMADNDASLGLTGGLELRFKPKTNLRLEGFYTEKTLSAYTPSPWFSESPPLPERNFQLYAFSAVYSASLLGIAADWAYSDTFAYGRDMYGNLGIRIGNRPWRLSLGADAAGNRYVDRDGSPAGPGFRLGMKAEYYGRKTSLFRVSATFRADEIGSSFQRSSAGIYYRFPRDFVDFPIKLARFSVTVSRNASNLEKIEDKLEGLIGITWGPVQSVLSGAVSGIFSAEDQPIPFPILEDSLSFGSAKISGEVSYRLGIFGFKTSLGYTVKNNQIVRWNLALYASVQGKRGGLSLKAASPDFPARWTYTVSWRLQKR
jgi:hypothetical protein